MLAELKKIVRQSAPWRLIGLPIRNQAEVDSWLAAGRPIPPPHAVKVRNLLAIADLYGLDVLVETGTFKGDLIAACKRRFKQIYSIEIFEPLAQAAMRRFDTDANVKIVQGDSGVVMPDLLKSIKEPVVFWLDGHFSGDGTGKGDKDSPVIAEVEAIARLRPHGLDAILIDDAREFTGLGGYPPIDAFMEGLRADFGCEVLLADDVIVVLPKARRA